MNFLIKALIVIGLLYLAIFVQIDTGYRIACGILAVFLFLIWGEEKQIERIPIPPKIRSTVFKRDDYTCQHCGRKPPEVVLECDHKTPLSWTKKNIENIDNFQTLCRKCNIGKGNKFKD